MDSFEFTGMQSEVRGLRAAESPVRQLQRGETKVVGCGWELSDDAAREVAREAARVDVRELDLSRTALSSAGFAAVLPILQQSGTLRSFRVDHNPIGSTGIFALARVLEADECSVRTLSLRDTDVDEEGGTVLLQALVKNSSVTAIDVGSNPMSTALQNACKAMAKVNHAESFEEKRYIWIVSASTREQGVDQIVDVLRGIHQGIWAARRKYEDDLQRARADLDAAAERSRQQLEFVRSEMDAALRRKDEQEQLRHQEMVKENADLRQTVADLRSEAEDAKRKMQDAQAAFSEANAEFVKQAHELEQKAEQIQSMQAIIEQKKDNIEKREQEEREKERRQHNAIGRVGFVLHEGHRLTSASGRFFATVQQDRHVGGGSVVVLDDGNVVAVDGQGSPIWATNTNGDGQLPVTLEMCDDGNLVVRDAEGHALWGSVWGGKPGKGALKEFTRLLFK